MKRFLRNCIVLLLAVAAILWLGGLGYKQTTAYQNLERNEETEHYRAMPEVITFAVFGASHGRDAFQEKDFPNVHFFNFSMSSQTPQYDLMQMRQFQKHIAAGATVVLTVSYMSPFWTESEADFASKQARYYRILSPENIVDCSKGRWVLERWSPLLTTDIGSVVEAFAHPQELRADTNTLYGQQTLTQEVIESEQQRVKKDHLSVVEPAMPAGSSVMLAALREMAALCRENGWNAVFVTPPYPDAYTACYPAEVLERFDALMTELSAEMRTPWLDYSRSETFAEAYSYFKNIDHLNLAGAEAFAKLLRQDLAELA